MKLQKIAAVVALLAAGAANAAVTKMDGGSVAGDSSVFLVMLDSTGSTTRSLTIDLGFSYSQFNATGALSGPDQLVTWNLANNTLVQNGQLVTGATNAWSEQADDFFANADAGEVKWALVAGSRRGNTPVGFLATGTPTNSQLTNQNAAATANFVQIDPLFTNNATRGTHATADNGAFSAGATDVGYVGTDYAATTSINGWKNNLKWNGWTALGGSTNVRQLNANGTERTVGDTATFAGGLGLYDTTGLLNGIGTLSVSADGRTITWATAALVPEPQTYALTLVGLVTVGLVARRRRAK